MACAHPRRPLTWARVSAPCGTSKTCSGCHPYALETNIRFLDLAFPEVGADPTADVYLTVHLADEIPGFTKNFTGGVTVRLHSGLSVTT